MYLCLLPSSATVKMNNTENIKNYRYATNDDTAGFIHQMKNTNISRKNYSMICTNIEKDALIDVYNK